MKGNMIEKDIGPEAKLKVQFVDGKIQLNIDHQGKIGGAGMYAHVDAYTLVDAITDAIPGEWDDALIDPIVKKLTAKKTGG